MNDGIILTPEQKRKQRARNVAIGLALGAMVILFFLVTVVKISGNMASHVS